MNGVGDSSAIRPRELSVGWLFDAISRQKRIFLVTLIGTLALAFVYLHIATRKYTVTMELMPSVSSSRSISSGNLGALSSLAGISLGEDGDPNFRIFVDSLQSPVSAEALATNQELLHEMFPLEWSSTEKKWHEAPSSIRFVMQSIKQILGISVVPWSPPSTRRVYDYLQSNLKVIQDQKSGVVTLKIESENPTLAARILVELNQAMDALMRERALARSELYINYLTQKLSTVTVAELRTALLDNLSEQERTKMMASSPVPFVSEMLGSPMVSSAPTSPSTAVAFILSLFLGSSIGAVLAALAERYGWRPRFGLSYLKFPSRRLSKDGRGHRFGPSK